MMVLGCGGGDPRDPERGDPAPRSSGGKADLALSCAGSCGMQASGGCWCDAQCEAYGDCCQDKVEVCDDVARSEVQPQPCHGVCAYDARCSDYCPPKASCIWVGDQGPGYWQVLGCGVYP